MSEKGFFHIPNWAIILLCIISAASLCFELVFFLNLDTFETISVNGIQYHKGTEQYQSGIGILKSVLMFSAGTSVIVSAITGYFAVKRIKNRGKL